MRLLARVLLTDQQTSKMCYGCKEESKSHRNVALEMSSLRVMVKEAEEKKQQEEIEKGRHVVGTGNNLFKSMQNVVEITTRTSHASLIGVSHGIPHAVEDSWPVDPQPHLPSLSSLQEYFRS